MSADTTTFDFQALEDSLNVLLVEDNRPVRMVMASSLKKYPRSLFEIVQAESCHEAVAVLAWQRFDVIVLDLNLPDSEGLQTLRRIRAVSEDAAVVVMTGEEDDDMIVGALELGAQDYLVKTDKRSPQGFVRSLLCALQRKQMLDAAQQAAERYRQAELQIRHLVRHMPVCLYALDGQGRLTLSEGDALRHFRLAPGQAVGESVFDLFADQPEVAETLRRAIDGEAVCGPLHMPTGELLHWTGPMHDDQGQQVGASGLIIDQQALANARAGEDVSAQAPVLGRHSSGPIPAGMILVVDDNEEFRDIMLEHVRTAGLEAVGAWDGKEALEAFEYGAEQIACVVMDREMPEPDGLQTCGHLRRRFPTVPVVLVASAWSDQAREQAMQAGAYACLEKPVPQELLIETVYGAVAT